MPKHKSICIQAILRLLALQEADYNITQAHIVKKSS